ncbi:MAG: hypothetical protein ABIK44_01760 [candidate division WOR-3 bacterium]
MTKLQFSSKDIFRSLRLGLSAKRVWIAFLGLLFGFAGYSGMTYLAYVSAGNDWLTVWELFRLLPFPRPSLFPWPWFSWLVFGAGVLWFLVVYLVTGTCLAKVVYESLRGDEFYSWQDGFRFALSNAGSVLLSPVLLLGFAGVLVLAGLCLSGLGRIPELGQVLVGLLALPAFFVCLFLVYLGIVLLVTFLLGPAVVGCQKSDVFDTLFETFSCVNEVPSRLAWCLLLTGFLAKLGLFLAGLVTSAAGRFGALVLRAFMGDSISDLLSNGSYYFLVTLPSRSWLSLVRAVFVWMANLWGLPQVYRPGVYTGQGWGMVSGSALIGVVFYLVALLVLAYSMAVWFSGLTVSYLILTKVKDGRNLLEVREDESEPVTPAEGTSGTVATG